MAECLLGALEDFGSNPMVALFIFFYFLILLFYLECKTTSRRAGLSAIAEFLVIIVQALDEAGCLIVPDFLN